MIGGTELKVGIGDMKFSRGEGRIITYALGSCIGITFYDPVTRLGALLHIMLPAQFEGKDSNPFKFADSGIRETLRKLKIFGMVKSRMVVKIAGGAKMFEISGNSSFGNIGQRNAESVKKCVVKVKLISEGDNKCIQSWKQDLGEVKNNNYYNFTLKKTLKNTKNNKYIVQIDVLKTEGNAAYINLYNREDDSHTTLLCNNKNMKGVISCQIEDGIHIALKKYAFAFFVGTAWWNAFWILKKEKNRRIICI